MQTKTGGFWTSEKLKQRLPQIVEPYDPEAVKACAYEMCVGEEAFVSGEETKKLLLKEGETIVIPPGQIALVITKEKINAPLDGLGFLSIKSSQKLRGLINISGFHVDPGFHGKLVFSMYNAGMQTIHLSKGSKLFMIWFCSFDNDTKDSYSGQHNYQEHIPDGIITNAARRMPSPFTLENDIHDVRLEMKSAEIKFLSEQNNLETKILAEVKKLENLVRIGIGLVVGCIMLLVRENRSSKPETRSERSEPTFDSSSFASQPSIIPALRVESDFLLMSNTVKPSSDPVESKIPLSSPKQMTE